MPAPLGPINAMLSPCSRLKSSIDKISFPFRRTIALCKVIRAISSFGIRILQKIRASLSYKEALLIPNKITKPFIYCPSVDSEVDSPLPSCVVPVSPSVEESVVVSPESVVPSSVVPSVEVSDEESEFSSVDSY